MYTPILFVREVKTRIKRYIPWLPFENRFRFYQVEKDKFYRSSQLTEEALEYFTKEGLIGSLVILRKNPRKHEFEFAKKHNIALLHIPIYMRAPTEKEAASSRSCALRAGQGSYGLFCLPVSCRVYGVGHSGCVERNDPARALRVPLGWRPSSSLQETT